MKALLQKKLTVAQQKALDREIRAQCVERVKDYEIMLDAALIYALRQELGFGKDRLKRIYDAMFRCREEAKEFYKYQDSNGTVHEASHDDVAFAMLWELKQLGIDVEAWYDEQSSGNRLIAVYKGGAVKYE